MEDRIARLENDMVEMKLKYTQLLEDIERLKEESTEGGIILDGCNDEVRKFIEQESKKDGDK